MWNADRAVDYLNTHVIGHSLGRCAEFGRKAGDAAIIHPIPGHSHGHMTMHSGRIWISDLRQRTMYPGQPYREHHPPFTVYRYAHPCAAQ